MRLVHTLVPLGFTACLAALGQGGCASTPPCERNSDCSKGYCLDGECRQACVDTALDCPKGYACNLLSQCEPEGMSAAAGSGAGGAMAGVGAGGSSNGATATSTATSGGGSAGLLDRCNGPSECTAGLSCQPMTVGGVSRCTRPCAVDGDCMTGTRCIDRSGKFCLADDVGRACAAPSACNFGCLTGPKYCTAACSTGADCPAGFGCQAVGSPPTKVCVKAAAYCDQGDTGACLVPAACDLSPTQIIGGCTLACTSPADCPQRATPLSPWTCDGVCQRPADVVGSLPGGAKAEYFCDASSKPVALCNDAQHIDFDAFVVPPPPSVNCNSSQSTPGVSGDSCVDSCRYRGGCSHGFACVAVGSVGAERIGLCLPQGAGEVGSACTKARDCVFGYCTAKNVCSRDCTEDGVCPGGLACVAVPGPSVEGKAFRRCE
ncbi:MAG: hypothetical protein FJ096_15295 [Deltaproteobacteria bacterium]|nr:hypothetical protein [Deltaproteobacteria bacterium]